MLELLLACGAFVAIHVFVSGTRLRDTLVRAMGERAYMAGFSVLSIVLLVWIIAAYPGADARALWYPPEGMRHLAMLLMLVSVFLVVAGVTTKNPTAAGMQDTLQGQAPVRGIVRVTRHPFLWGVALWALAHLFSNGEARAVVLFGSFLVLALVGPHLIDAKRRRQDPQAWQRFADATSWVPFVAVAQGRAALAWSDIGWWRVLASLAVYLLIVFYLHEWLFGLPPMPM